MRFLWWWKIVLCEALLCYIILRWVLLWFVILSVLYHTILLHCTFCYLIIVHYVTGLWWVGLSIFCATSCRSLPRTRSLDYNIRRIDFNNTSNYADSPIPTPGVLLPGLFLQSFSVPGQPGFTKMGEQGLKLLQEAATRARNPSP